MCLIDYFSNSTETSANNVQQQQQEGQLIDFDFGSDATNPFSEQITSTNLINNNIIDSSNNSLITHSSSNLNNNNNSMLVASADSHDNRGKSLMSINQEESLINQPLSSELSLL